MLAQCLRRLILLCVLHALHLMYPDESEANESEESYTRILRRLACPSIFCSSDFCLSDDVAVASDGGS